jgi:hypothetical protein
MRKCAALLMTIASTGCANPPVVATVDTLCVATARYHASEAQAAAFKADQALWEPLVNWLLGFNRERDRRCSRAGVSRLEPASLAMTVR